MIYNETTDIFGNITDEDIESIVPVPDTEINVREYLEQCTRMYPDSLFIDILYNKLKLYPKYVTDKIYHLSHMIDTLFDMYRIEHSDIILYCTDTIYTDEIEIIDKGTFKIVEPKNKFINNFTNTGSLIVYLKFPADMNLRNTLRMMIRLIDSVWKYNKPTNTLFTNILLFDNALTYQKYQKEWYLHPHLDFTDNFYEKPNNKMRLCTDDEITKWTHYNRISKWFSDKPVRAKLQNMFHQRIS